MPEAANDSPHTVLGFDYGTHKIGVAVGQTVTGTASPLETLQSPAGKPDWGRIAALIAQWRPSALIVGLPMQMDNREAPLASRAKRFARQLQGRYRLPAHLVDERLTSHQAAQAVGRRAARDVTRVDAYAAKLIVETWLGERVH